MKAFTEYMEIKGYAPDTRKAKIKSVEKYLKWLGHQSIDEMQAGYNDVMAYIKTLKQRGLSPTTQRTQLDGIRTYYEHLIALGETKENPCMDINIKGIKRKTLYHVFSAEELNELYKKYVAYVESITEGLGAHVVSRRNKVMLGLIIYQGLLCDELEALTVEHVNLREGKITVPPLRKTNERELKLEAHQIYDMMDYVNETRKGIQYFTGKKTNQLILTIGQGDRFNNMTYNILKALRKIDPRIKNFKHLRASVITNWLKIHDTRRVQYMAGHRYVSSTEGYKAGNMEDLINEVEKYHPLG